MEKYFGWSDFTIDNLIVFWVFSTKNKLRAVLNTVCCHVCINILDLIENIGPKTVIKEIWFSVDNRNYDNNESYLVWGDLRFEHAEIIESGRSMLNRNWIKQFLRIEK